jgi:hypothetical protein
MHQGWRNLLFLHFPCEPEVVQALLPPGLFVDTFPDASGEGRAWIGLVPFQMQGIRLNGAPLIPGTHGFPETNLRTYVHRDGRRPGVWFFSLDAANTLACATARRLFSLPYHRATMTIRMEGVDSFFYEGTRWPEKRSIRFGPAHSGAAYSIRAEAIGRTDRARAGTLEFFLMERYLLYSRRGHRLFTGRVHHPPYEIRSARAEVAHESLCRAAGLAPQPFSHAHFSPGVHVEVFPLRP